MQHESMEYDVVIVGAGPAGLSAAISLMQHAKKESIELSVCLLEKGSQIGAHNLSGAVLEPKHLKTLIPEILKDNDSPLTLPVSKEKFNLLTKNKAYPLPLPKTMNNHGNYIISISKLCQYLATKAESLGVEIYPGFTASDILYDDKGNVIGIATKDVGIDKNNEKKSSYEPGMHLLAKQTLFCEGARGYLSEKLIKRFSLRANSTNQTYGLGVKEIWQVKENNPGEVFHSIGWPLDSKTYGGSFIYHLEDNKVAIGFVVGLDYKNPYLDIFKELQRFKTHPSIKSLLDGGKRLFYGARALNEGGYQSIPKLTFPGGAILGCAAGFLNVGKIKGIHNAIHSGQIAASAIIKHFKAKHSDREITEIETLIRQSEITKELHLVRNIRPSFHYGLFAGLAYSAIDQYLFRGKAPWTFSHQVDNLSLLKKGEAQKINYPKPDNKITFDKASSLYLSGTFHEENQPCHLKLKDEKVMIDLNHNQYDSPETRYCPAGVYEIIEEDNKPKLTINGQNCLHCKTCDIKDITQNIIWTTPEGGGGPSYSEM